MFLHSLPTPGTNLFALEHDLMGSNESQTFFSMIEAGRITWGEARASGEWLCWGTQNSRDTCGVQDSPGCGDESTARLYLGTGRGQRLQSWSSSSSHVSLTRAIIWSSWRVEIN